MQVKVYEIFRCPPNVTKIEVLRPGAVLKEHLGIVWRGLLAGSEARFQPNPRRILTVAILKGEQLEGQ